MTGDSNEAQALPLSAGTWIGREEAFNLMADHCSAARVACLKQVRDTGAYKQLNLTWEQFCPEHAGISRSQADRLIQHLAEFGAPYFQLTDVVPVAPVTYREIAPAISEGAIEYLGEQIPIIPENAAKIKAAVTGLRKEISRIEDGRQNRIPAAITTIMMRIDSCCHDIAALQRRAAAVGRNEPALDALIAYSLDKLTKLKPK